MTKRPDHGVLLNLKRWNTPTIYNGWEQITSCDASCECFNHEPTHDFMPQMGPMIGYAVTLVIAPSAIAHKRSNPEVARAFREYVTSQPGPKIVVVQDLDKPAVHGSFWGEVTANCFRALGCVGTITDGAIRDLDEMTNAGFKALAQRLCVGHAHVHPVRWGEPVEVFGLRVEPGQLIHADKHGFLAIPSEDEADLLDAVRFMDENECTTVIPATRSANGATTEQLLEYFEKAAAQFGEATRKKFRRESEFV